MATTTLETAMREFEVKNLALLDRIRANNELMQSLWRKCYMEKALCVLKMRLKVIAARVGEDRKLSRDAVVEFTGMVEKNTAKLIAASEAAGEQPTPESLEKLKQHADRSIEHYKSTLEETLNCRATTALARASDKAPFLEFASKQVDLIKQEQEENLKRIRAAQKKSDALFRECLKKTDEQCARAIEEAKIASQKNRERLIAERDQARTEAIRKRHDDMDKAFEDLYAHHCVKHNARIVAELEGVDLETIDASALNGKTLIDFCFTSAE